MRIAIDVRKIEDFGIGSHIFNFLKALSRLDKENEYFLIGFNENSLPILGKNFNFLRTKAGKYSISEHLIIPFLLKKIGCDLFHSPHYVTPLFYRGTTTVVIHDVIHLLFPQFLPLKLLRHYAYFQIGRALKVSKIAFTVSDSSKGDILKFYPWAEKKIKVVYNGVDERFFERAKTDLVERFKKELGKFALYIGNTKPHKNIEIMLRAMKKLKGRIKLVIAGGVPNRRILEIIKEERLEKDVIFKGFLPFDELLALYESSHIFIFPSLYEGFGLPPLEAMAKGVPVISSSAPSMPEILKDGALYFNPFSEESILEAINNALEREEIREKLISEGKKVVQNYKWSVTAEKILNYWREIK